MGQLVGQQPEYGAMGGIAPAAFVFSPQPQDPPAALPQEKIRRIGGDRLGTQLGRGSAQQHMHALQTGKMALSQPAQFPGRSGLGRGQLSAQQLEDPKLQLQRFHKTHQVLGIGGGGALYPLPHAGSIIGFHPTPPFTKLYACRTEKILGKPFSFSVICAIIKAIRVGRNRECPEPAINPS